MFSSGKNKNGCFDCDHCPRTSDEKLPRFCVMWWEYTQMNDKGDQRTIKECGFRSLPLFLTEVIKASNRPAAAIESMRDETVNTLKEVMNDAASALTTILYQVPRLAKENLLPLTEEQKDAIIEG